MGKLFSLILPVILIFIGGSFIKSAFMGESSSEREYLQNLVDHGVQTSAVLDSEYKVVTTKIKRLRIKKYEVTYTFDVDGKKYVGEGTLDDEPTIPVVQVMYLPSDPSVNEIDPASALESAEKIGDRGMGFIGLGLLVVGLFLGLSRLRSKSKTS